MIEGASSLTMSVPNIITTSPSGGRFDFDDGGTYCGGWQDGKAHGHGVCTGPKNVGEYSGSWNFGFEMSGVYKWTNGAVYEGRWQNGKRHGVGVEYNGKWHYKGEWSQGLKGRYGVKASSNSAVKYEGTWANGLQDGYGSETYSDGGYYQGQMCRGLRHGYGVRKSAPYGDSQLNNPIKNGPLTGGPTSMLIHTNSMQSSGSAGDLNGMGSGGGSGASGNGNDDDSPKPEDGFKPNIDRTLVSKNGFVLVAKPLDVPMPQSSSKLLGGDSSLSSSSKRRNSLTNKLANSARIPNQTTASLFRGLRLKKQKSTSDLDFVGGNRAKSGGLNQRHGNDLLAGQQSTDNDMPIVPFTLSPEELDITDPTTVETYTGEWKHDKRNGHGICDRSDGLKYEGQWHNDMKSGYGVTTFKDGTKEEGKYKNNILIVDSKVKRFFQLGGSNIRQRIDDSVKLAQQAQTMALNKAGIADTRAATARDKADQAMTAAIEADRDSQIAYSVARQYSDSQQQQQMSMSNASGGAGGGNFQMFNQSNHLNLMDNQHQQAHQQPGMYLQSLNMAASPLQMRRISQNQQRNYYNQNQSSSFQPQQQQQFNNLSAAQQQRQLNNQYLDPVEPFNGRRGSFRVGSSQQSPPSGGYHPGLGNQQARFGQQASHHHQANAANATGPSSYNNHFGPVSRQPADPFSDLFDHYKSSSGASGYNLTGRDGFRSRRSMLGKQASLDQNHMRHTSVPRQLGASSVNSNERMKRFRMSSLDHADENATQGMQSRSKTSQDSINQYNQQQDSMQQQYRHLVTSGEDFQQQQQQQQHLFEQQRLNLQQQQQQQQQHLQNQHQQDDTGSHLNAPTPTGSSYILPQSSGAGSSSAFNASNQSPSPGDRPHSQGQQHQAAASITTAATTNYYDNGNTNQSGPGSNATGYNNSQVPAPVQPMQMSNYASIMMQQQYGQQRDVHSLADEQLYLANRRRARGDEPLDRTEYTNYDFAITSGPRPTERCMRRTASLSRATPINLSLRTQFSGHQSRSHLIDTNSIVSGSISALGGGGASRISTLTSRFQQQQQALIRSSSSASSMQPIAGNNWQQMRPEENQRDGMGNHAMMGTNQHQQLLNPNSCETLSALAAGSPLCRKPSLQVRYDTTQLGGLMSREEVAALSHAQREQKRAMAELAERRAEQPILHFFLALRESITRHQLIISVLLFNVCFMKLFADLIV